jgi:crotonobetainyl-CoA:carnitine CoA-transferase CaiB-like acyl-CoA transferase
VRQAAERTDNLARIPDGECRDRCLQMKDVLEDEEAPVVSYSKAAQTRPGGAWLELLHGAGIPCGAIKTVGEVCEAPQLIQRSMVQTVAHRVAGDVRYVARPLRFDDLPPAPSTPPPALGEHTSEVFENWLGWTRQKQAQFAAAGAFGDPAVKGTRQ